MLASIFTYIADFIHSMSPVRIIRSYQKGVLFRLGKDIRELGEGIYFVVPFFEDIETHSTTQDCITSEPHMVETSDGVSILYVTVVRYKVVNVRDMYVKIGNLDTDVVEWATSEISSKISTMTFSQVMQNRRELIDHCFSLLSDELEGWGVELISLGLPSLTRARAFRLFKSDAVTPVE